MPRIAALAGAWVLQRLVLESIARQAELASDCDERLTVGGDEMRHRMPAIAVPVQPESAIHRVDHPVTTPREFAESYRG